MTLSLIPSHRTTALLSNQAYTTTTPSAASSSRASNQITYPYSPKKFLWAEQLISSHEFKNRITVTANTLINDLSQNTLPYGPKTCKLVGKIISRIYGIQHIDRIKIIEKLLFNELATKNSFPEHQNLYNIIWKELRKGRSFTPIILNNSATKNPSEEIEKLLNLTRVQQDPNLRNHAKINSSISSPANWLKDMITLLKTQFLENEHLEDLVQQLIKLIKNNGVNLSEEMCKDIGRLIVQMRLYKENKNDIPLSAILIIHLLSEEERIPTLEKPKHPQNVFDTIWKIISSYDYPCLSSFRSHESFSLPENLERLFDLPRVMNNPALFRALDAFFANSLESKHITEILPRFAPYLSRCMRICEETQICITNHLSDQYPELPASSVRNYIEPYLRHMTHIICDAAMVTSLANLMPHTLSVFMDCHYETNTAEIVQSLKKLKNLTSLGFYYDANEYGCSSDDNSKEDKIISSICDILENLPNITNLCIELNNLKNCNKLVPAIAKMVHLTHLDLSNTPFSDVIALSINNLPKLNSLNLINTQTTQKIFELIDSKILENIKKFSTGTEALFPRKTKNAEPISFESPDWPLITAANLSVTPSIQNNVQDIYDVNRHLNHFGYKLTDDSFYALGNFISYLDSVPNLECRIQIIFNILKAEMDRQHDPSIFDKLWKNIHLYIDFDEYRYRKSGKPREFPNNMEHLLAMSRVQNNPELLIALDGYIATYELDVNYGYPRELNQTASSTANPNINDSDIISILEKCLERYGRYLHICPQIYSRINKLIINYLTNYPTEASTTAISQLLDKHKSTLNMLKCDTLPCSHDVLSKVISQLPNLEKAVLNGICLPRDEPLKHLMKLNGLTSLTFQCSDGNRDFNNPRQVLTDLNQLILNNPNLKELNCTIPAIPDGFYDTIGKLKHLNYLRLDCYSVTNEIGSTLRKLSNLETLNLRKTAVTDTILVDIQPTLQPKLEELYLRN